MKSFTILTVAFTAGSANAFMQAPSTQTTCGSTTALYEYIPSGFTKDSWAKFKAEEAKKKAAAKNLGRMGPKGFQSRSMQSFQEALERGEAAHLLPVFNAKEKIARGELKPEDIPYMQRGGAWDNSDVKGAKKKKWLASDKAYADYGEKAAQSMSILGVGAGLDWTGSRDKQGPAQPSSRVPKNYKAPNVSSLKGQGQSDAQPKKKMFGLF